MNYFKYQNLKMLSRWLIAIFLIAGIGMTYPVEAAQLTFDKRPNAIYREEQSSLGIIVDTEGEEINAIQGALATSNNIEIKAIRDGQSIIGVWTEKPEISTKDPGVINFSGIIPGGYEGNNGPIFFIDYFAKNGEQGVIELKDISILKNDGLGTPINTRGDKAVLKLVESDQVKFSPTARDLNPPESFSPEISRNELMFDNQYFVVFQTTDKQSGIDHYEISEVTTGKKFKTGGTWQRATSPYLLKDQTLESDVYIRAVDRVGNFIIIKLPARDFSKEAVQESFMTMIITLIIIVCLSIFTLLLFKKIRENKDR